MKFGSNMLFFKALLMLAGLVVSAACAANESAAITGAQTNIENATQSFVAADGADAANAKASPKAPLGLLALNFKNAAGTPAYYAEAVTLYCNAGKTGNANALYALGWLYVNGRGVEQNNNTAALLFTMAAEQGHARAQELLATLSEDITQTELPKCLLPDPPAPVAIAPAPGMAELEPEVTLVYPQAIFKLVEKLAPRYQIDTRLAMAFIAVESGFNPRATSPKNAQGLMQLIPETAKRFRVKNTYNPEDNIKGGLAYLQWLMAVFKGDVRLVAAAYNSGERTVEKYRGVPPYPETQKYVRKIASLYRKPSHPYRDDLVSASSFLTMR